MMLRIFISVSLLLVAVGTTGLQSQTLAERQSLAAALNAAGPAPTTIPLGTNVSLRQLDGSCGAPFDPQIQLAWLGTGEMNFRMMNRASGGTVNIVEDAHPFVCDLNSWLGFTLTYREDYKLRDTGNAKLKYNTACGTATSEFFTVFEDAPNCTFGLGWQDYGSINPWGLYRRYYAMTRTNGIESANSDFRSSYLCKGNRLVSDASFPTDYSKGSFDVFIGRRNQSWTDWLGNSHTNGTELHRSHSVLQFDYRFPKLNTSTGKLEPDPDSDNPSTYATYPYTSYVLPWLEDPTIRPRLDSIVFTSRLHEPEESPCTGCALPSDLADILAPDPNQASRTVKVYFTENVPSATACSSYVAVFTKEYSSNDPQADNEAFWNNTDFSYDWITDHWMEFRMDPKGNVYLWLSTDCQVSSTGSGCGTATTKERKLYIAKVRSNKIPDEYCDLWLPGGGTFEVEDGTGALVYAIGGNSTKIHCLDFCEPLTNEFTVANVISAAAQTFDDRWEYDPAAHGTWAVGGASPYNGNAANDFEKGVLGKWRPKGSWAFRSDVKPASMGNGRVYDDAGVFVDGSGNADEAFHLFNWIKTPDIPSVTAPSWLNASTVTRYAPSGEPVEEKNILGIYGTAKLAHNNTVPRLVAQNAQYDVVDFQSFEDSAVNANTRATFDFAHAGRTSYKLETGFSPALLTLRITDQIALAAPPPPNPAPQPVDDMRGVIIKFWLKRTYQTEPIPLPPPAIPPPPVLPIKVEVKGVDAGGSPITVVYNNEVCNQWPVGPDSANESGRIYKVAQTGEWSLYQLIVDDFMAGMVGKTVTLKFAKNAALGPDDVWIDDIRAQPINAQMGCYVYDRDNLRLLTQFDDQHFGLFYQYNGEGKLVRKLRETERGLKTVAETQYHTPLAANRQFADGLPGSPINPPDAYSAFRDAEMQDGMGTSSGNNFDLLNLRIGRDGIKGNLFGDTTLNLRDLKDRVFSKMDLSRVDQKGLGAFASNVPQMKRMGLLKELVELEQEGNALAERGEKETSESMKREIQDQRDRINARKEKILKEELGLTDGEIRALYDELRKEGEQANAEGNEEANKQNDSE